MALASPAMTITEDEQIRSSIDALRLALNGELIERADEIDVVVYALLTRFNAFFLGTPGTAKTMTVDRTMARIAGVRYSSVAFFKSMPPEEVLGQISLSGLQQDRYLRNIEGFFPWADVALADEGPRASSAVLSALLRLANERTFRQDGQLVQSPLSTMFVTANSWPDDPDLEAFWDRMVFRRIVKAVSSSAGIVRLMRTVIDPNPAPVITWAEILRAQELAAATPIGDAAIDAFIEVRRHLVTEGITVSDRKTRQVMPVLSAAAWLAGAAEAGPEHLEPLVDVLWEAPGQVGTVEEAVLTVASPQRRKAIELRDAVMNLGDAVDKAVADVDIMMVNELVGKVTKAGKDAAKLAKSTNPRTAQIGTDLAATGKVLLRRLWTTAGFDPDIVAAMDKEA